MVWENPIAPLQQIDDIKNTVFHFIENNLDSLFTVKKEQVQTIYKLEPINFKIKEKFSLTQDLEPVFPFVPFIMMWKVNKFLENYEKNGHAFFSGKVGYYPVGRLSSIIIKYEEDFRIAENILNSLKQKNKKVEYYKSLLND